MKYPHYTNYGPSRGSDCNGLITSVTLRNYNPRMSHPVVMFACSLLTFIARTAPAQDISRAYCGKDGKAHLVYRDGAARIAPTEPQQVGCDHVIIARDGRTVGWSVLIENCCTSYSIPTTVVVYHNGKQTVISPDQMVWEWRFIKEGKRVAVLSGPVHGGATAADLYDAHDGKVLERWNGKGTPPTWAMGWEQQFGNRE